MDRWTDLRARLRAGMLIFIFRQFTRAREKPKIICPSVLLAATPCGHHSLPTPHAADAPQAGCEPRSSHGCLSCVVIMIVPSLSSLHFVSLHRKVSIKKADMQEKNAAIFRRGAK